MLAHYKNNITHMLLVLISKTGLDVGGSRGGGTGGPVPPPPCKIKKNIVFLSNTGPDPLKYHKATMLGHHRHASETLRWRTDDGPIRVVVGSSLPLSTKKRSKLAPTDNIFSIRHGLKQCKRNEKHNNLL